MYLRESYLDEDGEPTLYCRFVDSYGRTTYVPVPRPKRRSLLHTTFDFFINLIGRFLP